MARTRRAAAVGVGTALVTLLVAASPAAAGPVATVTNDLIRALNANLLYAAVPVTVLVEGVLIYTVWEFRESRQDGAEPTRENRLLEITWTVATAVILVFVGVASYQVLAHPMVSAPPDPDPEGDPVEVTVVAQRYFWTFQYEGTGVETRDELVLPTDRPIVLNVTSVDWLHSFHVPGMGLKQDAVPGRSAHLFTEANEEGTYQGYCAEYCGVGHSRMLFTVEVTSEEEYRAWLADQRGEGAGDVSAPAVPTSNATAEPTSNATAKPTSNATAEAASNATAEAASNATAEAASNATAEAAGNPTAAGDDAVGNATVAGGG